MPSDHRWNVVNSDDTTKVTVQVYISDTYLPHCCSFCGYALQNDLSKWGM